MPISLGDTSLVIEERQAVAIRPDLKRANVAHIGFTQLDPPVSKAECPKRPPVGCSWPRLITEHD